MKGLVVALLLLAIVGAIVVWRTVSRNRPMSPQKFADAVRQKIESEHPEIKIEKIDGFEFVLKVRDGSWTLFLDNSYAAYRRAPDEFDGIIHRLLKATNEPEPGEVTWEQAQQRLLPALTSQPWLDEIRRVKGGGEITTVVLDYRDGLKIALVVDSETSMVFVDKDSLRKWRVTAEDARKRAVENLAKLTGPLWAEATERARQHGIFVFCAMDGYDASRVLLPDYYERASRALECKRLAVAAPTRDFLIAMSADDPSRIAKFRAMVRKDFETKDHAISPEVIFLPE